MAPVEAWLGIKLVQELMPYRQRGLENLKVFAMANLHGVAKCWWADPVIRESIQVDGFMKVVQTEKGRPVASQNRWCCVANTHLLRPVIRSMAENHLLKTPYMEDIERQVRILSLLSRNKGFDANSLPDMLPEEETPVHLHVTSLKRMIGFCRRQKLRPHCPRDRVIKRIRFIFSYVFLNFTCPNLTRTQTSRPSSTASAI